ncbi:hypothetical protein [Streptomyces cylindrosporus]|uniref:Uncharacterized protein n=1 Tax=Streptomyces cylindrosporus TaxID=2927583 RepID=A0ABS9YR93_9ACTN|nr:hypothetical protein [Streptomyces cylindrosporus]MCI3279296.1 hypothetical protein [Streptomyces cylindrosporus]
MFTQPVTDDPTGQGLFFPLIALSTGSYASAPRGTAPVVRDVAEAEKEAVGV